MCSSPPFQSRGTRHLDTTAPTAARSITGGGKPESCSDRSSADSVQYRAVPDRTVPSLSGAVFLRNVEFFRKEVGSAAVESAFASLPQDQRDRLHAAVPAAWMWATDVDDLYYAIADASGRELLSFYSQVVRQGIEQTLRSVWRVLIRLSSPRALLLRAPIVYGRGHSAGTIVPTILGPGRAKAVLTGWRGMSDLRRVGVATGIETLLSVSGRQDCSVEFEATVDGAVFHVSWTP